MPTELESDSILCFGCGCYKYLRVLVRTAYIRYVSDNYNSAVSRMVRDVGVGNGTRMTRIWRISADRIPAIPEAPDLPKNKRTWRPLHHHASPNTDEARQTASLLHRYQEVMRMNYLEGSPLCTFVCTVIGELLVVFTTGNTSVSDFVCLAAAT